MAWFFTGGLFVLIATIAWFAIPKPLARFRKFPAIALAVVFIVVTGARMFSPIQSGEVGVVYRFGEIVDQRGEGIAVIAPWESIVTANIRTQRATFEQVTAASKETQDVFMTVTVNYSLSANAVQELYRTVGTNWFDVLVPPRIANYTKAETAKYSTVDIIPERETIRRAVLKLLADDLEAYSITINDLLLDQIDFQPAFKSAIEDKQVATENAKREQEKVGSARAVADQQRAQAQGDADAEVIRATGAAEANRVLAESLTPAILQNKAIEELGDRVQIALVPTGEGFILDPSSLLDPETFATAPTSPPEPARPPTAPDSPQD